MGETTTQPASGETDAIWLGLLADLSASMDDLVEDFLARLSALGLYEEHLVPPADLRDAARDSLDMLIRRLSGAPLSAADAKRPALLGTRRARQGVDRDSLLEAVRLDYRVLWAGLRRAAGDARAAVLVEHADHVLTTVERYIGDVQVAFLNELDTMARSSRHEERRALARLISAKADDLPRVAEEVAGALRLRADAELEALCITRPDDVDRARASGGGRHTVEWDFASGTVLIRERVRAGWADHDPQPVGGLVDRVGGLRALPAAVRLAQRLAPVAATRGGLAQEADAWPAVAASTLADVLPSLAPAAYPAVATLEEDERDRLLATVRAYCRTGSVKLTAESLFLHRNTVQNRLGSFAALTGLDVTVPEDAARALIAFATP